MVRLHQYKIRGQMHRAADLMQALFKGYMTRRAYVELKLRTIQIQRWRRRCVERRLFRNINREFQNRMALLIQKYCRGYLAQQKIGQAKNQFQVHFHITKMVLSLEDKRNKIITDLQVKLAYLWRRKVKHRQILA